MKNSKSTSFCETINEETTEVTNEKLDDIDREFYLDTIGA